MKRLLVALFLIVTATSSASAETFLQYFQDRQALATVDTAADWLTILDADTASIKKVHPAQLFSSQNVSAISCPSGQHVATYNALTGSFTCTADTGSVALPWVTLEEYGYDGLGTTNAATAYNLAAATGKPILLTGTYLFTGDITLSSHLLFFGGKIKASSGATVHVNSFEILKGSKTNTQIFEGTPILAAVHNLSTEPAYRVGGVGEVILFGGAYYRITAVDSSQTALSETKVFTLSDSTHLYHTWDASGFNYAKSVYTITPTTAPTIITGTILYERYGASYSPGWWGAGETVIDSAPMIQHCINQASTYQGSVYFGEGFACTIRTTLLGNSNVSIRGSGRTFGATTIHVVGCEFINFDGSMVGGGWIFRSQVKDLVVGALYAMRTYDLNEVQYLIKLNFCYNVDVSNIWISDSSALVNIGVSVCNDVTFSDVIIYGYYGRSASSMGFNISGSTVAIKNPDIEVVNFGFFIGAGSTVDIYSPYVERAICALALFTSPDGQVSVYGGTLGTNNGYPIKLSGNNLTLFGTKLASYSGANPISTGMGVYAFSVGGLAPQNINFYNVVGMGTTAEIAAGTATWYLGIDPVITSSFKLNMGGGDWSTLTGKPTTLSGYGITNAVLGVGANDIEIINTTKGLILTSPNGSRYRLAVSNSGVLSTSSALTYAPSAPTSVVATAGDTQATLTWIAGLVDGTHSAASQYNLWRGTSTGTETLLTSNITSPYVNTGLTNGVTYFYKVAAFNSISSARSTEVSVTPTAAVTTYAPNAPTSVTATPGDTQVTLSWVASSSDGTHSAATQYDLWWSDAISGGSGTEYFIAPNITSPYIDTGLTNGLANYYKIRAINSAGGTLSAEATATPIASSTAYAPNAPTGVSATPGTLSNSIAWTNSAVDGTHSAATSYSLFRAITSGSIGTKTLVASGMSTNPHTDSSLTAGTPYYYQIQASNSIGTAPSAEFSGTPTATPTYLVNETFTGANGTYPNALFWSHAVDATATGTSYTTISANAWKAYVASTTGGTANSAATIITSVNAYPVAVGYSVSFDITINAIAAGGRYVVSLGSGGAGWPNTFAIMLDKSAGGYSVGVTGGSTWWDVISNNNQHTIKLSITSSSLVTVYLDGVALGTSAMTNPSLMPTTGIIAAYAMTYAAAANDYIDVTIDNLQYWQGL